MVGQATRVRTQGTQPTRGLILKQTAREVADQRKFQCVVCGIQEIQPFADRVGGACIVDVADLANAFSLQLDPFDVLRDAR